MKIERVKIEGYNIGVNWTWQQKLNIFNNDYIPPKWMTFCRVLGSECYKIIVA